jgi:hypothetical protein
MQLPENSCVTRSSDLSPTPFPIHGFVALGAVWVLLDVFALLFLFRAWHWSPWTDVLLGVWGATLAAKVMLMLGWVFLGEGTLQQRLIGGVLIFSPLLVPLGVAALFDGEPFCLLVSIVVLALPVGFLLGIPYLVLRVADFYLLRGVPPVKTRLGQFTVRQLMLVTLVVALVSGVLHWSLRAKGNGEMMWLLLPLLAWVLPFAAFRGCLQPRWYPEILFAAGLSVYVVALPIVTLRKEVFIEPLLFVVAYVGFFLGNLLVLRWLGFRLVQFFPGFRYDPGIWFIDSSEPGIVFLENEPLSRSAEHGNPAANHDGGPLS